MMYQILTEVDLLFTCSKGIYPPLEIETEDIHPWVNSGRKRALAIVRQTVAIANSNTGNLGFLSTLISKAARAG